MSAAPEPERGGDPVSAAPQPERGGDPVRVKPPPEGFRRLRMTLGYDGSGFHGFARNPGVVTVQGELEAAAAKVLGHAVSMSCAGRTDAGVHAQGQVVSFDADAARMADQADIDRLARALNRMLNPAIAVFSAADAADSFDARFSCAARSYRYRVLDCPVVDPLAAARMWHVRQRLDVAAMDRAARQVIGSHDFASFAKRNRSRPDESLVREVLAASWTRHGDAVELEITAVSFAHQMVRSLVAMFVDIGRGRRRPDGMAAALAARDRSAVPSPAPPHGLVLVEAHHPD